VAGGSTQLKGVSSDIVLPSLTDNAEISESALRDPMPYDEVAPADYEKVMDHPLFITELGQRSSARVASEPEFKYITEDLTQLKQKLADNTISLNEQNRRDEIAKQKAIQEKRTAERAKRKLPELKTYLVTLENIDKPELELVKNEIQKPDEKVKESGKKTEAKPAASAIPAKPTNGKTETSTKPSAGQETSPTAPQNAPSGYDDQDELSPDSKGPKIDPVRVEALNILNDFVALSKSQKTASTNR
jgi:carboxyl-terminal processing protease